MTDRFTPDPVRSRRPVRAALSLAFVAVLAGLYACAPKITRVDASYTMPEGVVSPNANLLVWGDQPTTAYIYGDVAPADPDTTDTLITTQVYERYTPNVLHGIIIDRTQADAFQLFRREAGGGVRQFTNYPPTRTRTWLGSEYEAYHFIDTAPSGFAPATYVARGVVEGVVNDQSPLTNLATPALPPITNISLKAIWYPPNHKLKLNWVSVPGAVRYLLQVYEFRGDLRDQSERVLSGTPSPFYDGQATELFIGYVPGDVNFMFVGDSSRTDITTFMIRPMLSGSPYMVRLAALDASGHMIGLTLGDANPISAWTLGQMGIQRGVFGNGTYMLYRLGATTARDTVKTGGGGGGGGLG